MACSRLLSASGGKGATLKGALLLAAGALPLPAGDGRQPDQSKPDKNRNNRVRGNMN
jgi:hypothetical protein